MIIADEKRKVVRSSGFQESTFKIETSSKAFNILSSKLYSDQYQAIVRELCTNASDAHVNAGISDVPIEVHLPDFIDQSFSVRDYGNGIDPEEFEKIYTTYFYSTKTSSDTQVGCFGLGSKSPFAYTKQFTVENNYNGHKYIYLCFENENGEPSVSLIANSPTEDKGVKVSFSVKNSDNSNFRKAADRVLSWFDLKPKCNDQSGNIKNFMSGRKDERFVLLGKADGFDKYEHTNDYNANIFVRMGQVIYPCDSETLKGLFVNKTVIINANIGDVDITPSRESLEYRTKTNNFIEEVKNEFLKDIRQSCQDVIKSDDKTEFKKFEAIFALINNSGISRQLIKDIIDNEYQASYDGSYQYTSLPQDKFTKDISFCRYDKWRDKVEILRVGDKGSASVHENSMIVIKDKGANLNAKIKELIKNHVRDGVYYTSVFIVDLVDKDLLKAGYGFQESDLLYSSQLTYNKDASPSKASTGNNCTAMTYTINGADRKGIKLDKDNKDGYYLKDSEYYGLDTSSINNIDVIGDKTVYIFTDNQFNSLKVGERNFVNFLDYLVDEVQTNKDEIIRMLSKDNMRSDKTWQALQSIHAVTSVASIIDDYVLEYNDCQLDSRKIGYYEAITNIIRRHNHSLYQEIEKAIGSLDIKHREVQNKIKEKYPLLKVLIDNKDFDGIIKQVAQYVDLVSTTIQKDGEV